MPKNTGQINSSANTEIARQQAQQQAKSAQASRKKAAKSAKAAPDTNATTTQRTDQFLRSIQKEKAQRQVQSRKRAAERQQVEEQKRRAQEMNQRSREFDVKASVKLHQPTKSQIIQVRDRDTNTLLDQVPSDEYLNRKLNREKQAIGRLIDKKA